MAEIEKPFRPTGDPIALTSESPLHPRRTSRRIMVGPVPVGGGAPISVQSMTNTVTADVPATLRQIAELTAAGCDIVRVAVPSQDDADALPEICAKSPIPVIADIHFQSKYVFQAIDAGCAAVRVNPGNIRKFDEVGPSICKAATDAGIMVGPVPVGGGAPISVQSMTNTVTADVPATLRQIAELTAAGCDIVRVAVPSQDDADALPEICAKSPIPVIADIHFQSKYVFQAIDAGCAAVRVNPGNIRKFDEVGPSICKAATDAGISLRIGVNAGSLDKELYAKYGGPTPEALVASALKEAHMFEDVGFHDFKISVKHHDVITMVQTYRLLASKGDWPLHLGVTEAGPAWQGTIKSCLAFGALLAEGIGDTIRVSLSAPPVEEVKVGCKLLEYMGLRPRKFDIISCPSCGRAQVDVIQLASAVTEGLKDVTAPIRVAVMGCIVNGPGEAREADLGVASGNGKGQIFIKGKVIETVPEDQIVETLLNKAQEIAAQMEADGQVPVNSTGPVVVPIQNPGH